MDGDAGEVGFVDVCVEVLDVSGADGGDEVAEVSFAGALFNFHVGEGGFFV